MSEVEPNCYECGQEIRDSDLNVVTHDGRCRHLHTCPPRTAERHVDSLGPEERDAFWKPADRGWPVYWWRADIGMWVCAPTITASIQTYASVREDGRVHNHAGFDELAVIPR